MTETPATPSTWPGRPAPLGATWDGEGTNLAVYSADADAVELCLGHDDGTETRLPMLEQTAHVWHCYVPRLGPGSRYAFRAHGAYDPPSGRRFDPSKLLADPYARALTGSFRWDAGAFVRGADTADRVPWSVVVDPGFPWGDAHHPHHALADSVIYELHVRGFTKRLEAVPEQIRGTYAGLAHPAAIDHLHRLGVTAVELMPVHHFVDEPHLQESGLTNYWGYNSLGYFAPHAAYSASGSRGEQVREFRAMVRSLHEAGIEVILDVVYNHTAEGDETGPTLSYRGLDNAGYYRLADDRSRYVDYTGCGNTLDARQPHVLQVIMDSLRYWVTEMRVDGFRFDLAAALARSFHDVDKLSGFFDCIAQDPVVNQVKLIAEPWDVGEGGYQVGEFPQLWAEWNGKFRDTVRDTWRGADLGVADLAYRLTGSSDLYQDDGRAPSASINFVTSHDGFSLADLVSYDQKHNEANGEANRDGSDDNRSWSGGAEGPTDSADVLASRRARRRSLLATLLLSAGVPMLRAGDEIGATQAGNNNAYCQDDEVSWLDWTRGTDPAGDDPALTDLVAGLIALRRAHPVLRRRTFFSGQVVDGQGRKDIGWFGPDGRELADWTQQLRTLGVFLAGDGITARGPRGERIVDDSFLLWLNACGEATDVVLPDWASAYSRVLDTGLDDPFQPGDVRDVTLLPWSVLLLRAT